MEMDTQTSGS